MSDQGLISRPRTTDARSIAWLLMLNDPAMRPLIEARDETSRAAAIAELLVRHGIPAIERSLERHEGSIHLDAEDREELRSVVSLKLVEKLHAAALYEEDAIANFGDYVSALAGNALYDFLRRRFPERYRLKSRLRYLFARSEQLALWQTAAGPVCGLRAWRGREELTDAIPSRAAADATVLNPDAPERAVAKLLSLTGKPVRLELLVQTLGDLWNIAPAAATRRDTAPMNPALQLESRQYVERLWEEIRLLPPLQRVALLLNLRDPDGVNIVSLMVVIGVATEEEVAVALDISTEELSELWSRLPLDDLTIAQRLGRSRQQIINLRKSARERLSRRMSGTWQSPKGMS